MFRARDLVRVITDAGVEIREIRLKDPGKIIWKDGEQTLALATDVKIPRAFCILGVIVMYSSIAMAYLQSPFRHCMIFRGKRFSQASIFDAHVPPRWGSAP